MKALELIKSSSFNSRDIERLSEVLERIWASVADGYPPQAQEAARLRLARIVLDLGAGTSPADLEAKAADEMCASLA